MESGEVVKREARHRDWMFWAAVIWTVLFIGWMYYISRCFPGYSVEPSQVVRFSELITAHSWPNTLIYNPLAMIFVFNLGVIGLVVVAKRLWLLLMLLTNLVLCWTVFNSIFCINTTALQHLKSIDFDSQIYHLTQASHVSGDWDTAFFTLDLYTCDSAGELCRGQTIRGDTIPIDLAKISMTVDVVTNTLKIIYWGSVIFTIEAG